MADHHHSTAARSEHVMLELGDDVGALVLYTDPELHGEEIELSSSGSDDLRTHKQVHARPLGGETIYAAVFDRVDAGEYTLWHHGSARDRGVRVSGAAVTELDWRFERLTFDEEVHPCSA
jgi:hypothetical protein